jgi:ssDNA-binding Zn-finger/Zn-ribbon topoisomerase 1
MINVTEIKQMREETGAGLEDCRAALTLAQGDWEKAKEILRVKGQAVLRTTICPKCRKRYEHNHPLIEKPRCPDCHHAIDYHRD